MNRHPDSSRARSTAAGRVGSLLVWLALLSGMFQLVLGIGRFGWLLNLVSSPVMTGFTQAAAILILVSQLPALLGMPPPLACLGRLGMPWRCSQSRAPFSLTGRPGRPFNSLGLHHMSCGSLNQAQLAHMHTLARAEHAQHAAGNAAGGAAARAVVPRAAQHL